MMQTKNEKIYDYVFLGTSPISVLEAIYQNLSGHSVLMVDDASAMGGAWLPLNLFGFENVENAIHYFLPDPKGFQFMRERLGWRVVQSKAKYRVFEKPVFGVRHVAYDNPFGKFLGELDRGAPLKVAVRHFFSGLRQVLSGERPTSVYVEGGAAEMLAKVKQLLAQTSVEIRFRTKVESIAIEPGDGRVHLSLRGPEGESGVSSKTLFITHGSRLGRIRGPRGELPIVEKVHPRPAAHLLVRDRSTPKILEAIFNCNKILKYAHDITRYATSAPEGSDLRVFVLALHPTVKPYAELYHDIFAILKDAQVVGPDAVLEGHCWWDVFLPALDDNDLELIRRDFREQISFLKTENFARGIGLCADRWSEKIQPPQEAIP